MATGIAREAKGKIYARVFPRAQAPNRVTPLFSFVAEQVFRSPRFSPFLHVVSNTSTFLKGRGISRVVGLDG